MTDLATLGFQVNSEPLARAKAEMQGMVPAAQEAGKAVDGLSNSAGRAAAASAGLATTSARTGQTLGAQSATITRLTNEYRQLSTIQSQINAATGVSGGFGNGAELLQQGQYLDSLRAKYNPLFAAQRQYKQELIDIRGALRQGAISEKEYADAIMNTKTAFTAQVNSLRGVTDRDNFFDKSAEGATRAGKAFQGLSFDARNLSYQLVDVGQGLLMGQSPFMIFAQQAGQIGQIAATSEKGIKGLFAEIGSGIAKVLTPMRLLTVGVLGLGIGLIALVKNAVDSSKAMDDLAKSINTTRSLLHGLEQVAGGRGISTDDFAAGMKSFGDQVYLAKRNMGDLVGLLRANGVGPVKNLQDAMQKVADLVARTKDDQQAQKAWYVAQVATARQRVNEACSVAVNAEREAERQASLRARGFVSQAKEDSARSEAEARRAGCAAARADVLQAEARVRLARVEQGRTMLYAPFAGTVAKIVGEVGEYSTPSPPGVPTPPAIDLIDDSCLYVRAPMDEVDAPRIAAGQPVRISLDALPKQSFAGRVKRVAPYVSAVEKQARTVDIEADFDDPAAPGKLLVGYSADIEVILDRRENVVRVPTSALLEGGRVLVAGADGRLEERQVKTGLANWEFAEVVEGLAPGDRVVTSLERAGVKAGVDYSVDGQAATGG